VKKLNTKIKATFVACALSLVRGSVFAKVVNNVSYVDGFIDSTKDA
jgi:hypothetical protein